MRPKCFLSAAFVLLLLPLAAFAGDLEDAQALQQAGDYEQALAKYEAAASADPTNADAAAGLTEVLSGLGRYEEASRAGTAASKANPDHVGLALARARAYMLMADAEAAIAGQVGFDKNRLWGAAADCDLWLKVVLAADPKSAPGRVLKAKVYQHQADQEGALKLLEETRADHPDDFDVLWEIGQHWYRLGGRENDNADAWANAYLAFSAAFAADPTSGEALRNATFSRQWLIAKDKARAAELKADGAFPPAYLKVCELLPGDEKALRQLYNCYRRNPEARLAPFKKLLDETPKSAQIGLWYGYALMEAGKHAEAVKVFETAMGHNPKDANLPYNLGTVYRSWKKMDKAIESYEQAVKLWNGRYLKREYGKLSELSMSAGLSLEQRERLWTALWKGVPSVAWAANNAGFYYRDSAPDYDKSLKWYLRAAEVAVDDPAIQNDAGLIYLFHMKGQEGKSEPFFRRAIVAAEEAGKANTGEVGYRDAVNNLIRLLTMQERWKDLGTFAEEHLRPDGHPRYDEVRELAEKKDQ